jgi:hypothetical protein
MPPTPRVRPGAAICAAAVAIGLTIAAPRATGQSQNVWKANSVSSLVWSDQNNWTAQVIANGQLAVFSSSSARFYSSTNDVTSLAIAGMVVNGINTAANPITIGGNAFSVGANGIDLSAATTDLIVNTAGLTAAGGQSWTLAASRTIAVNTLLSGSGMPAWTVAGAGTVKINAGGSGMGNVSVTGGTLQFGAPNGTFGSGSIAASGTSTLAGIGSLLPNLGSTAANLVKLGTGTTLSPGVGGIGTLTVGSTAVHATAELDSGSIFAVDLGTAVPRPNTGIADVNTNDRLVVYGIVDFTTGSGNETIAVNGAGLTFTPFKAYDFFLASGSDGLANFNASHFTIAPANFALPGSFAVQSFNNNLVLTYSPVPEASHVFVACAAVTGLAWWVRFWRRRWIVGRVPVESEILS